jgi:Uncharacterised conserved protein
MAERLRHCHQTLLRNDRGEAALIRALKEIGEIVVKSERVGVRQRHHHDGYYYNDHDARRRHDKYGNDQHQEQIHSLRDDECFAYFCEHSILRLMVEVSKNGLPRRHSSSYRERGLDGLVLAIVNSNEPFDEADEELRHSIRNAKIKAQVLRTVTSLVSGVKDKSALFYLLSQHSINHLILQILPLSQWTDPVLEEILLPYADLLKTLALQLGGYHSLFPFFTVVHGDGLTTSFPLYSAILHTASSTAAHFDSFLHANCLNLLVGLLKISDPAVTEWMGQADHSILCRHLDRGFHKSYQKLVDLTTGPIVDNRRSNAIKAQTSLLDAQIDAINDIFWCSVTSLNRQLCETILAGFVQKVLDDLRPQRVNLSVGISDNDVIPDQEAKAQVSFLVLSRIFAQLEYEPLARMLAVSFLYHSKPSMSKDKADDNPDRFPRTMSLGLLMADDVDNGNNAPGLKNHACDELFKALSGSYGEWRFLGAAALIESVLGNLDMSTLQKLNLLGPSSIIEGSLQEFLSQDAVTQLTPLQSTALERATFVSLQYLAKSHGQPGGIADSVPRPTNPSSPIVSAIRSMRDALATGALKSRSSLRVNDIFVGVVNSIVCDLYKTLARNNKPVVAYHMFLQPPEVLTRMIRSVPMIDVEQSRGFVKLALHFRAVCFVMDKCRDTRQWPSMDDLVHPADNLLLSIFPALQEKWPIGTDIDLQGRTTFPFDNPFVSEFSAKARVNAELVDGSRNRTLSEDMVFRASSSGLVLVLDPTDMFIVKPLVTTTDNRGTIVCGISLLDVVGAAADDESLHIAVRHENVGFLIKNGNLALSFDSPSTSMVVSRCLDRCCSLLRREMYEKIEEMLTLFESSSGRESDDDIYVIHHSRTY